MIKVSPNMDLSFLYIILYIILYILYYIIIKHDILSCFSRIYYRSGLYCKAKLFVCVWLLVPKSDVAHENQMMEDKSPFVDM